ncbi:MAG TPA: AroM family protein [bacterium]|nr:AroM family protein [bacterium]
MTVLGAVTIGQSPRSDIIPELRTVLPPDVEILEAGALDGLSAEEIAALAPRDGDAVLVTRLRDGRGVRLAHRLVVPRLIRQVERIAEAADAVLLLCTGSFEPFRAMRPILYPERLLFGLARAVAAGGHIGVITPDDMQVEEQRTRWGAIARTVSIRTASPYTDAARLPSLGRELADAGAQLLVLDSLGYSLAMKQAVRRAAARPVLLPRTVLARAAAELL